MYDKKIQEIKEGLKYAEFIIDQKRHVVIDTKEYFKDIHEYLKKADSIEKYLSEIERKYESILKEK